MDNSAGLGGLARRPTGPQLCAELALIESHATTDEQLMDQLSAEWRQLAYQQARTWTVMAEIAVRDPMPNLPGGARWTTQEIFDSAVDEIRAELRMTRRAAGTELANAVAVAGLPKVMRALNDGTIDRARALVFAEACVLLTEPQAAVLVDTLLPDAAKVSATWLKDKAQRVAIALDPAWARRRYKDAVRDRKIVGYLNPDGSAVVTGQNLPADEAAAACARVDALADAAKRAGAAAKIDHLRVELFLGLLDGRFHGLAEQAIIAELLRLFPKSANQETDPATDNPATDSPATDNPASTEQPAAAAYRPAVYVAAPADLPPGEPASAETAEPGFVDGADAGCADVAGVRRGSHVRVGLGTLLGLDESPGEIAGWGTVPAPVARTIVAGQLKCEWRFAILDADGKLLFDGVTRRRPTSIAPQERGVGQGERGVGQARVPGGVGQARVPGGIVELHVPVSLLTDPELANRHSEWAALLADLARQHAKQRPIEQDPTARFAGRPLRRRQQTLFQRCIFPSCRRTAADCDLDHHRDYTRGGRTEGRNLGPGCRHDHTLKTSGGWRLSRRDDNTYVWISPLGRKHVVEIDPIASPLPASIPHEMPPRLRLGDDLLDPTPTYQPRDQRGRPLTSLSSESTTDESLESTADPPPF